MHGGRGSGAPSAALRAAHSWKCSPWAGAASSSAASWFGWRPMSRTPYHGAQLPSMHAYTPAERSEHVEGSKHCAAREKCSTCASEGFQLTPCLHAFPSMPSPHHHHILQEACLHQTAAWIGSMPRRCHTAAARQRRKGQPRSCGPLCSQRRLDCLLPSCGKPAAVPR